VDVNLLGDERAAGSQDPADLGRPERLVPASDQPEHAITEGQPPPVVPGLPGVARRAFILDDRDAQRPQPDRRSPPPVPMSSRAPAAAARRATSRR